MGEREIERKMTERKMKVKERLRRETDERKGTAGRDQAHFMKGSLYSHHS